MDERFQKIIARTPTLPGVYLFKNQKGKLVYVGKAKNLRARLKSYFDGSDPRPFVRRLARILGEVETILTRNEKEALLLENRLIKTHQPHYNVRLKDDKDFVSLRIDTRVSWPRVEVVRRPRKDGASYFGPYHSAVAIRHTLRILNRYFQLRTCNDHVLKNRTRPCLLFQIKRCPGPCVHPVDAAAYRRSLDEAILFLEGRQKELVNSLRERMEGAAQELEFEKAAHYRDQILDVQRSLETQQIEGTDPVDRDVFGLYRQGDAVVVELLIVRQGHVVGTRRLSYSDQDVPDEEVLSSLLLQYYDEQGTLPPEVLLPMKMESSRALEEILGEQRGGKVAVIHPQRGERRALVDTANRNAEQAFQEVVDTAQQSRRSLEKLCARLHLDRVPQRIECFDISNLSDTALVGSMVVFVEGEPDPPSYRTFRIKTVGGQDDFASLMEVLSRRIRRSQAELDPWPDLMVIDGGKGQLNRVVQVLEELGAGHLHVVSLAKSRLVQPSGGQSDEERVRTEERVFLRGVKDPIALKPHTAELYLMQRIRDEAHRVAITYHRKLRKQRALGSVLNHITGVGEQRRTALLRHFGSVNRLKTASEEELMEVTGISSALARRIRRALDGGD